MKRRLIIVGVLCVWSLACNSAPSPGSDRGRAAAHYDKAVAFYAKGKYQDAAEEYQLAIQDHAGYREAHFGLGVAFIKTGFYRGAALALKRAIDLQPAYPEAYLNLGLAQAELGQEEKARTSFRTALSQDPDLQAAWYPLAQVLAALGKTDSSIAAYRKSLVVRPYDAHVALAEHYRKIDDTEQLISHLRAATVADSSRYEPWVDLGGVLE